MSMTSQPPTPAVPDALTAQAVATASVEEVLRRLDSSSAGLSSAEASARLTRSGRTRSALIMSAPGPSLPVS